MSPLPLLLLPLLLAAPPARAAEWVPVPTWAEGDVYWFDQSKLAFDGAVVRYWKKVQYRQPVPAAGGWARSSLFQEEIHCDRHEIRRLGYFLYGADGKLVQQNQTPEAAFAAIMPDTIGEAFEAELCARRPPPPIPEPQPTPTPEPAVTPSANPGPASERIEV